MSRLIEGSELEETLRWMHRAVELGQKSPCQRDQRGVVIVKNGILLGEGVNAPPEGFTCEPKYCQPTCRFYAVHAEMNAIADAVRKQNPLQGSRMYHARVEGDKLADSRKPRCGECSKHVLTFGIADFVLKHEEGFTVYDAHEFNYLSINAKR